jgi:peptide/nickel transport system permease protein
VLPAVIVEGALRFSYAIFLITSLGFLGLGVQPPSPDWGRMVNEARDTFDQAPWALWFPAAAIAMLVIAVNLLSDGLRRVFRYEGSAR